MIQFICCFCPSLISSVIYEKITQKKLKLKDYFIMYGIFVMLNNMLTFGVFNFVIKNTTFNYSSISFSLEYLIISIISSFVVSYFAYILPKNFSLKVNIVENEKKKK